MENSLTAIKDTWSSYELSIMTATMLTLLWPLLLLLQVITTVSSQPVCFVKPNASQAQECPGQPCFTLDQYTQQAGRYFTTGSHFLFLPGDHSLQTTLSITNVSNITLGGEVSASGINIVCSNAGFFLIKNATNLTFQGLVFVSLPNKNITTGNRSIFNILNTRELTMLNLTFEGRGDLNEAPIRAISFENSNITIVSCRFTAFNGGAIYADRSNITLDGNMFSNNRAKQGAAILAIGGTVTLKETLGNTFTHNSAESEGGAVSCTNCHFIIKANPEGTRSTEVAISETVPFPFTTIFSNNQAYNGGALYLENSMASFKATNLIFVNNSAEILGGAIQVSNSSLYLGEGTIDSHLVPGSLECHLRDSSHNISKNCTRNITNPSSVKEILLSLPRNSAIAVFSDNQADHGGAIYFINSCTALLNTANVVFSNNSANQGGALYIGITRVTSTIEHLYFIGNMAYERGGAIMAIKSDLVLRGYFADNAALTHYGGAIYHQGGVLEITGYSHFTRNHAKMKGGAIFMNSAMFIISCRALFTSNHAESGGAIHFLVTHTLLNGTIIEFINNSAVQGGGIDSTQSQIVSNAKELNFQGNSASFGGAMYVGFGSELTILAVTTNFVNNFAKSQGGAMFIESVETVVLHNITATGNTGGAIYLLDSRTTISGQSTLENNFNEQGGALYVTDSVLLLTDYTLFRGNRAITGGAIYALSKVVILLSGVTIFEGNRAEKDGGAVYSMDASISFNNTVKFISNSAQNGGAMFFDSEAKLTLEPQQYSSLNTSYNHASEYGGVIYHEDSSIATLQCEFGGPHINFTTLPYCFMDTSGLAAYPNHTFNGFIIDSYYDSADKDGDYMYGGLIDKCYVLARNYSSLGFASLATILNVYLKLVSLDRSTEAITSKPYLLCFCNDLQEHDCSSSKTVELHRGQRFSVSLVAVAQNGAITSTTVTAKLNPTASLKINQSSQTLSQNCTETTYNVYSTKRSGSEALTLYPDGPCIDRGLATAVINVNLLPCPEAFVQLNEECVCEERLQAYNVRCIINEDISIQRVAGANFWMSSALYENNSYEGLILYQPCPLDYCKIGNVTLSLENPDVQCDLNRSGVLCGACATNYSLMLGSSRCQDCSNTYLSLLVPFAAAGIALVVFLSVLRLTVATGMINSIILYANIVQANRSIFLPTINTPNVLTIFIAWLNLDLGFETCFYDGMTAYAQTWLQFAFPVYIWILMSLIILTSRYSIIVSKLIGHNPIAVLATLLLMSYTKILKIIIEVLSSVNLDYPGDRRVRVWLKDANVPYLESEHLALMVVTSVVLVFLFLPYTLLLLFGYKLYRFSGRRRLQWIIPLLDSYYAPYRTHTRYWTGFLLLVRCALYIVFSLHSLGPRSSLVAINIAFTSIIVIAWLSVKIYRNSLANLVEATVYLNLTVLSTASLASSNSVALVYSLLSLVLATAVGIIVYHFHVHYIAKSAIWLKSKAMVTRCVDRLRARRAGQRANGSNYAPLRNVAGNPQKPVSRSFVDLREDLLEDNEDVRNVGNNDSP